MNNMECDTVTDIAVPSGPSGSNAANIAEASHSSSIRMKHLSKALNKVVENVVDSVRFKEFTVGKQSVSVRDHEALVVQQAKFRTDYRTAILAEFELMMEEESIEELMARLDNIEQDQNLEMQNCGWRPTGEPCVDVEAHLMHSRETLHRKLEEMLRRVEESNSRLEKVVVYRREQVKQAVQRTTDICTAMIQEKENVKDELDSLKTIAAEAQIVQYERMLDMQPSR